MSTANTLTTETKPIQAHKPTVNETMDAKDKKNESKLAKTITLSHSSPELFSSSSELDDNESGLMGAVGGVVSKSFFDESSSDDDPETDPISGENYVEYAEFAMEQRLLQQNNPVVANAGQLDAGENIAIDDELMFLTIFNASTYNMPKRNLSRQPENRLDTIFGDKIVGGTKVKDTNERFDKILRLRNHHLSSSSSAPLIKASTLIPSKPSENRKSSIDIGSGIDFCTYDSLSNSEIEPSSSIPQRKYLTRIKPEGSKYFQNNIFTPVSMAGENSFCLPSFQPASESNINNNLNLTQTIRPSNTDQESNRLLSLLSPASRIKSPSPTNTTTRSRSNKNRFDRFTTSFNLQDDLFALSLAAGMHVGNDKTNKSERPNSS